MKGLGMATRTVLVIDDDPDIQDLLQTALEDAGYHVLTAVDGAALPLAQAELPDLILLDIQMPGMDGVEVSKRLRANPITASIPIIVMSAYDRLRAVAAAMPVNDQLPKPFVMERLYGTVARWAQAS